MLTTHSEQQFTYLKVARGQRRASEESRKYHVDWYWKLTTYITVRNLNVLNLRRCQTGTQLTNKTRETVSVSESELSLELQHHN